MTIRATWFFGGVGNVGWTETWFDGSGTPQAALAKADTNLRPQRLGVLSAAYSLRQIRASDENVLRDSQIISYTAAQGAGAIIPASDLADWGVGTEAQAATVALLIRMEAGSLNRRMFLMRGLPLGPFGADLAYQPTALWVGAFNAWKAAFTGANGYQLRVQGTGASSFPTTCNILTGATSISLGYPGNSPAGIVPGAMIRVSAATGVAFLNGTWRVSAVLQPGGAGTASTVFTYPKRRQIFGAVLTLPIVRLISPSFANFTAAIPLRGAKRNTGRPFGLPRGRARVRTG